MGYGTHWADVLDHEYRFHQGEGVGWDPGKVASGKLILKLDGPPPPTVSTDPPPMPRELWYTVIEGREPPGQVHRVRDGVEEVFASWATIKEIALYLASLRMVYGREAGLRAVRVTTPSLRYDLYRRLPPTREGEAMVAYTHVA